jgi:hypothetical protein
MSTNKTAQIDIPIACFYENFYHILETTLSAFHNE